MSSILIVAEKEFRSYFRTPVASIFLFFFLILTGLDFFFVPDYFSRGLADVRPLFSRLPWLFLFFAPAVSMKMWAEERKVGTIETLLTMPMRDGQIVLGKFLASFGLLIVALLLTFPIPLLVALTAAEPVDSGAILGSYIGAVLLGGTYIAISLFASSLTRSQIVAFILGISLCLFFLLIGVPDVANAFPRGLGETLRLLGVGSHFENVARGVLDSRDLLYYLSMICFFLLLNVVAVRRR